MLKHDETVPGDVCARCGLLLPHPSPGVCDREMELAVLRMELAAARAEVARLSGRVQELEVNLEVANLRMRRAGDNLVVMRSHALACQRTESHAAGRPAGDSQESTG